MFVLDAVNDICSVTLSLGDGLVSLAFDEQHVTVPKSRSGFARFCSEAFVVFSHSALGSVFMDCGPREMTAPSP